MNRKAEQNKRLESMLGFIEDTMITLIAAGISFILGCTVAAFVFNL